jgi:hypothetical protein
MTEFSPEAQEIVDAFYREGTQDIDLFDLAAALRALVNSVVPEETEAPKAVFDCEPTLENSKGELRHTHDAHLRRQFRQDELNIRWEQRRQTRALMLVIVTELEVK